MSLNFSIDSVSYYAVLPQTMYQIHKMVTIMAYNVTAMR